MSASENSPNSPGSEAGSPQGDWAAQEEKDFDQIEQSTVADAEQMHLAVRSPVNRWLRPFKRIHQIEQIDQLHSDDLEIGFEKEIKSEIASGEIKVPEGGPLTPEEIHEVEMNPWPGHSQEEAVARMRAQKAGDSSN
jgi:hypothetical protein